VSVRDRRRLRKVLLQTWHVACENLDACRPAYSHTTLSSREWSELSCDICKKRLHREEELQESSEALDYIPKYGSIRHRVRNVLILFPRPTPQPASQTLARWASLRREIVASRTALRRDERIGGYELAYKTMRRGRWWEAANRCRGFVLASVANERGHGNGARAW
jgi:hypothetical protein